MRFPRLRTLILVPLVLFAAFYLLGAVMLAANNDPIAVLDGAPVSHEVVAIFGASGTAGDGILKAALADPAIKKIHVITRRETPRIAEGVASGKVHVTRHLDYLDYSSLHAQLREAPVVFWAIGTSSFGVDEQTYGMIHVDFPREFVTEWARVNRNPELLFHYISSSDISEDSGMMWAREKVRAENTLFGLAADSNLRVIAYRPDYIGPTREQAHLGQTLTFGFFRPVGAAVRATEIGQTMIEVTARGAEFSNGDKIGTRRILQYSDAYSRRVGAAGD